jgi:putative intracellular protease/amidase
MKIIVFISADLADFEITLAAHLLRAIGGRKVVSAGYDLRPVTSQAGLTYQPDLTLDQAYDLVEVEGLILPGGPIREQGNDLTRLIQKLDGEQKLLAAVCFGPQYLGRAGVLDKRRFTTSCSEGTIRELTVKDPYPRINYVDERVVRDGHIITAKGGAFVDFAFAIAETLDVFAGREEEKTRLYHEIINRET